MEKEWARNFTKLVQHVNALMKIEWPVVVVKDLANTYSISGCENCLTIKGT